MAQINLRVDDEVKKNAEGVFDEIGISLSAAINIYLKKVARDRRIPFELTADPFYSEGNIKYLEQKFQAYKDNKLNLLEKELIDYED
ncbi:MAG: type II toxin-antitoxin system RelB/DinJ family antitoxin [Anaerococcus sp.]|nr:type II toxin-antitoxin system RelB/DinJ family antitoxin [Anaerococcus sp.]